MELKIIPQNNKQERNNVEKDKIVTCKKRIVIVDDATFSRNAIKNIFSEMDDWEVIGEASNGKEAIELYKRYKPDLITMDLVMPELGGVEAIERILRLDSNAVTMVVSELGSYNLAQLAMEIGAKGFIKKPFVKEKILESVGNLFK